jgi:hypothetical protein
MNVNPEHNNIQLSAGEIAPLWTGYLGDSMANCVLRYFLHHVEDTDIRPLLEYAFGLTLEHIRFKNELFTKEEVPIPHGFKEEDVNLNAPKLFTDVFMLHYLRQMGIAGCVSYSLALASCARPDIREFFNHNLKTVTELLNKSTTLLLEKGLFDRHPYVPMPPAQEFVHKEGWLNGLLGDRRPVNVVEITHLYLNAFTNALGNALLLGFAQSAQAQDVIDYLVRGQNIAAKHQEVFSDVLKDDHVTIPRTLDSEVMAATEPPFSDKLMLFHTVFLTASGLGNYGSAIAGCARRDLAVTYMRLAAEVGTYADDGAELLIKKGWLEKIPQAIERDALIKK